MKRILLPVLVIGILLVSACETLPTAGTPTELQLIKKWEGNSVVVTEPFKISVQPWAISWAHNPETADAPITGAFQMIVYDSQNPGAPILTTPQSTGSGAGTSNIETTGTFYVIINAAFTKWKVEVWGYK